jgi:hypothetical protein
MAKYRCEVTAAIMEHSTASASSAATLFQSVHDAFLTAKLTDGGTYKSSYRIGGESIVLHFAGPALIPLITPALSHLGIPDALAPDLTVQVWDSASTGISLPQLPWSTGGYTSTHGEFSYAEGRVHYRDARFEIYYYSGDNLILLDEQSQHAIVWMKNATEVPYYETAAPLRILLQWWLSRHACQLMHAAAVGLQDGGVLITAKGGSGKSTSALACLNSNLYYAGDDYVAVSSAPSPYVHSLYSSAKIHADNLHRVPHLISSIQNSKKLATEKALLLLNKHFPEHISAGFPLRALLVPRITQQTHTTLTPASPIVGLRALAPTTLFQLPGANKSAFTMMAQLVKQLPCYWLELGSDTAKVPDAILTFLAESNAN